MTFDPMPSYAAPTPVAGDPTNVLGRRFVAFVLDIFVPLIAAVIVSAVVWFGAAEKHDREPLPSPYYSCTAFQEQVSNSSCFETSSKIWVENGTDTGRAALAGGLVGLIVPLNLFVLQGLTGASIGKRLLGLRVVRSDGQITGFGWNALRTVLLAVDGLCAYVVGGLVTVLTHPHRRIGDLVAGSDLA